MDDALEAFTEAAVGHVGPATPHAATSLPVRIGSLQTKACALLGAWSDPAAARHAHLGHLRVPTTYLVLAAALEITVHGWDVARAVGLDERVVPDRLARRLLPVAGSLISPADRRKRFAAPLPCPSGAPPAVRLLATSGRAASWDGPRS